MFETGEPRTDGRLSLPSCLELISLASDSHFANVDAVTCAGGECGPAGQQESTHVADRAHLLTFAATSPFAVYRCATAICLHQERHEAQTMSLTPTRTLRGRLTSDGVSFRCHPGASNCLLRCSLQRSLTLTATDKATAIKTLHSSTIAETTPCQGGQTQWKSWPLNSPKPWLPGALASCSASNLRADLISLEIRLVCRPSLQPTPRVCISVGRYISLSSR